jgi:hypothetical protein
MNRPLPVTLSAILLGLLAALQLVLTVLMALAGLLILHKGLPAPPRTSYPPSFLPIMMSVMSLFFVALAVWSILTLIGLVRMRSWARYSVLVIAGCVAFFAGMISLMSFAMPFLLSSLASQSPAPNPDIRHGAFFFGGTLCAIFTAIGIALLVYFNLAKTRALFQQNAPLNLRPSNTSTGRPRPTAITVISWIYLISAPFCLIYFFLPVPGFLFGFVFYGMAAHLFYVSVGILSFAIGYGLLRLHNGARLAVFAWYGVALINALILVTPWGRTQFHAYMNAINTKMVVYGSQQPPPNFASSPYFVGFMTLIGLAICAFALWLLHRHREAFTPAPLAPPLPAEV